MYSWWFIKIRRFLHFQLIYRETVPTVFFSFVHYAHDNSFLQQVQVAALEVQNVKRAINRYGTLPKGARIGAYLESLRQNGIGEEELESAAGAAILPSGCLSLAKLSCAQPGNMMRSNSSGGFQPNAATVSAAAAAARNRAAQPCIADFEFPPPPPPEELECEDVTNLQPSTEEASFRFGVNLRHREPSTDSCNSAKSEPAKKLGARPRDHPPSPPNHHTIGAGVLPSATSVSLPPSPPDPIRNAAGFVGGDAEKHSEEGGGNGADKAQLNHNLYKSVIPGIMKEMMDLKLVSDNKGNTDDSSGNPTSGVDFKQSLRKTSTDKGDAGNGASSSSMFRMQLKKVDAKKSAEDTPLDMKSRLKRVDNGKVVAAKDRDGKTTNGESTTAAEEEDKRCSTGSINSLKKLWEGESPPEGGKEQQRKLWQPDEKPAIATKPTTKAAAAKPTASSAIYATPGGLANVLDIWPVLENNLNALKSSTNISSASWLLLSDKVCSFHASCLSYVDSAAPPHTKFHLRELLTKLETQSRLLRSAGTRNQVENAKVLNELHSMLKDVINAVQK